jgi:hypothetical protein
VDEFGAAPQHTGPWPEGNLHYSDGGAALRLISDANAFGRVRRTRCFCSLTDGMDRRPEEK